MNDSPATPSSTPAAATAHTAATLSDLAQRSLAAPTLERLVARLPVGITLAIDSHRIELKAGEPLVTVRAPLASWQAAIAPVPRVGFQSFGAMTRHAATGCAIEGEALAIAQSLPLLEHLLEAMRGQASGTGIGSDSHRDSATHRDTAASPRPVGASESLERVRGRYLKLALPGLGNPWIFEESAGEDTKPVMLMLHTAGADARQWHGIMTDEALLRDWRMVAFDMPSHGRSSPSLDWDGAPWTLTAERYLAVIDAWFDAAQVDRALIVGCSMGAAIGLAMLAERPQRALGAILLETPFRSPGRRSPFLDHPAVHGGRISAAWVQALLSPSSPPARRRRATWIYSQGAPSVYEGDLGFYSDEFDAAQYAPRIDTRRTPLALLTGEYDYSASPAETQKVADAVAGCTFTKIDGLGHFPMTEDPASVLAYLRPIARRMLP
jgi:pimeloyl-ACP methyl ester carboxylesterase